MTTAIYEIRVAANVFHATDRLEQHEDMLERLQRNGYASNVIETRRGA